MYKSDAEPEKTTTIGLALSRGTPEFIAGVFSILARDLTVAFPGKPECYIDGSWDGRCEAIVDELPEDIRWRLENVLAVLLNQLRAVSNEWKEREDV